jgi:hypothetical protein
MAKYYWIKPANLGKKKFYDAECIIVKLRKCGELEIVAGDGSLKQYGARLDGKKILVGDKYVAVSIDKEDAKRIQNKYLNDVFRLPVN